MQFIEKIPGQYWGFAYLRPRSEKKVALNLKGKGITHYLPLIPSARLHHGSKVVTPIPMIPGYIFLSVDDNERCTLKRVVDNFVQIELQRTESAENILIRELNALMQFESLAQSEKVLINQGIQRGDKIIITHGHLKGLETEVIRRDDENNSIVINITILNRNVEYPVSSEILKKITN